MDVRTEILQVSLKLFNEFGSENISTNEIAKKTDISTGTLYYYFKNKDISDKNYFYMYKSENHKVDHTTKKETIITKVKGEKDLIRIIDAKEEE